jgi:hypothetical protein
MLYNKHMRDSNYVQVLVWRDLLHRISLMLFVHCALLERCEVYYYM